MQFRIEILCRISARAISATHKISIQINAFHLHIQTQNILNTTHTHIHTIAYIFIYTYTHKHKCYSTTKWRSRKKTDYARYTYSHAHTTKPTFSQNVMYDPWQRIELCVFRKVQYTPTSKKYYMKRTLKREKYSLGLSNTHDTGIGGMKFRQQNATTYSKRSKKKNRFFFFFSCCYCCCFFFRMDDDNKKKHKFIYNSKENL